MTVIAVFHIFITIICVAAPLQVTGDDDFIQDNTDFKQHKFAILNEALTLECKPKSFPGEWEVDWKHGEAAIMTNDPNLKSTEPGILTIDKVSDAVLEEEFSCIIKYKEGDDEKTATSNFTLALRPTARLRMRTEATVGENLRLECKVTGKPKPKVTWTIKDDRYDESTERLLLEDTSTGLNTILTILNVTSSDFGSYKCTAANVAANADALTQVLEKGANDGVGPGSIAAIIAASMVLFAGSAGLYYKRQDRLEKERREEANNA